VNLLLQLPSGENPSPFKRMVDQLTQPPTSVSAEPFDQNEDLDALINLGDHPKPAISDHFKTGQR
jgi:hypothetical protein